MSTFIVAPEGIDCLPKERDCSETRIKANGAGSVSKCKSGKQGAQEGSRTRVAIDNGLLRTWDYSREFVCLAERRRTAARSLAKTRPCCRRDGRRTSSRCHCKDGGRRSERDSSERAG